MSQLRRTTLALISAVRQGKRFDPELIYSLMDWLEERHAGIRQTDHPLHVCLLEALDTYYQCLEHLVVYLAERHEHNLQESLLLVFQAEDLLSDVERQVDEHKHDMSQLWAA